MSEELRKKLGDISELPKEAKAIGVLEMIEKAMKFYDLSWIDLTKVLEGKNCLVCGSRVRVCPNCKNSVSVGTRNCLRCGENLEKVEIEPSFSKQRL
jgi:hypothetical protein